MRPIIYNKHKCLKSYATDIGFVDVYQYHAIFYAKEEVTITLESILSLVTIAETHYQNHSHFAFISVRKYAFCIDPTVYEVLREYKGLEAFAIVSTKEEDIETIKIEKHFFKKPMKIFPTLASAIEWTNNIILTAK
ncbi:STAS/SEC14 domain-containing protein [Zhouia sp. PK063]|uniref:STAS/SEC14 domain-containing protein n=1 Tax=Zhouia sp. PK063 TaxID=3373602 RepID=UPI0037AB1530